MNFQSAEFRQALGTYATGVTVITTATEAGTLAGLTVNSFSSVSLHPPLILWCLASSSESLDIFRTATYFAVNILAHDQIKMSTHFATRQSDKFKSIKFRRGKGGVPLIKNCVTWLQCRTTAQYEIGDHWVFIGEVEEFDSTGKETLLFHRGNYAMSLPFPEDEINQTTRVPKEKFSEETLYSLLLKAVHAYQERFEARQQQFTANSYEVRVLTLLHGNKRHHLSRFARKIQLPLDEVLELVRDLESKGLVKTTNQYEQVELTIAGMDISEKLWELVREHEEEAAMLFMRGDATVFRESLAKLIKWSP